MLCRINLAKGLLPTKTQGANSKDAENPVFVGQTTGKYFLKS
jgi:hypothetical protein